MNWSYIGWPPRWAAAELDAELGHDGLVELMYAIAVENHRARFDNALGITDQGFTSGEACRVPLSGS